ncbi:MAG: tetratricopeptide repeat protein, partial [Chloroflexota bacterium]
MSTVLTDAMDQAQQAYLAGDFRTAAESSAQIAQQFPHYLAAHRLLGLASLKQGRTADAERALSRVLGQDPCDPDAYLGLSMIHEERGVLEHALAYSQVAWELAPTLDDYRQAIERIASMRYGGGGHLQLTHAALAQLHVHNQRLRRAVREYETALLELPDRIDLRLGLAEILWRLGEDDDAAALARDLLEDLPDLARALVILADIEHRQGNEEQASQYLERLRRVDQDGRLVASMVERNERADVGFLLLPADAVPEVEIKTDRVVAERPTIAPAPDFTFQEEEQPAEQELGDLQPIGEEEFSDEPQLTDEPTDELVQEPAPEAPAEEGDDSLAAELEQQDAQAAEDASAAELSGERAEQAGETAPPDASEAAELEAALAGEPTPSGFEDLAAEFDDSDEPAGADLEDSDLDDLLAEFGDIEPMSAEDFGASDEEIAERSAGMFQDAEIDFDIRIEDEDAVQIGGGPPSAGAPETFQPPAEFGEQESLEPEEFPEFPDVEEDEDAPQEAEAESAEAEEEAPPPPPAPQPQVQSGTGYTRLLGELGEEGLAPFDPVRPGDSGDREPARERVEAAEDEEDPLAAMAETWDSADEDIASAVPTDPASTDELRDLGDLGVEPFQIDEDEEDRVESEAPAQPEPAPEAAPESPAAQEMADDADFDDLEPFSFDDFDDVEQGEEQGFSFGRLPWEKAEGDSAL